MPPSDPTEPKPAPKSPEVSSPGSTPSPMMATGLGALLFIISILLCIVSPIFFLLGFLGAFVCLFLKGYRCVFAGFILMIGVILLGMAVICGIMGTPNFH